eukprot:GEZU01020720.1.p1 GENE.GEZU01020720.1~~GEZU01020720.1.p1  ORF type:complete len:156 (-),score=19.96 GEZU01020720.1:95-562(-)
MLSTKISRSKSGSTTLMCTVCCFCFKSRSALESTKKERELAAMAMQQRKIATATTQEYSMIPSRARATVAYGKAFPGHQPEVDPTQIKHVYNPFETTTRATFCNPKEQVPPKHEPQSPLEKDPNQLEAYRQRWTKSSDLTKTRMQSTEHKISFSK